AAAGPARLQLQPAALPPSEVSIVLGMLLERPSAMPFRSSHASLGCQRPQQDSDGVGLVVVGRTVATRADRLDHRGLVDIAPSGDEALDGADRHALVGDRPLLAPGRQRSEQAAVHVRRVSAEMPTNFLEMDLTNTANILDEGVQPGPET